MLAAYALAPVALIVPSGVLFGCGLTVALDRGSPPADSTSGGQDGTGSPAGIAKDLDATRTTPGQLVQATERVVRAAGAAFVSVLMVAVVLAAPVVLARSTEDRIRDGKTVALPGFLPLLRIQRVTVLAPVGLPVTGTCVLLLGRSDGETIIFEPNRSDRHEGRVYRLPSDTTVLTGC